MSEGIFSRGGFLGYSNYGRVLWVELDAFPPHSLFLCEREAARNSGKGPPFLVDISAPKQKYLAPPPSKFPNSLQTPSRPSAPTPCKPPTPLLGFSIKDLIPPPSWRLALPLPPPQPEKNIKYPKRPPSFLTPARHLHI